MLCQILQGFDTFRKDNHAVVCCLCFPCVFSAAKQSKKFLISHEIIRRDLCESIPQFFQQADILDIIRIIFLVKLLQSLFNAFDAGRRTGEQGFFQTCLKESAGTSRLSKIHLQLHICKKIISIFLTGGGMTTFQRDVSLKE